MADWNLGSGLPYSLEALVLGRRRYLAGKNEDETDFLIIPNVVISEEHTDEVKVTRFPVDTGAALADHAYSEPARIHCRFGWSDSSALVRSLTSGSILQGVSSTQDTYKQLLSIMKKRTLLTLSTGKRIYQNVLIVGMKTTSSAETESALIVDIDFQEVLTAQAKTVKLVNSSMSDPATTAVATEKGSVSVGEYFSGSGIKDLETPPTGKALGVDYIWT